MRKLILLFLLLFAWELILAAKPDIKRVEPQNWWVGMKNPELQIMVYGNNIATFRPEIHYPGVEIDRIVTTTNPNYQFIYLIVGKEVKAGSFDIVFKDGKKTVLSCKYDLLERTPGSAGRSGFNSSDAMYLLMPDRFANGNPDNDSHPEVAEKADRSNLNGRHGGDIQGIIDHLDYLKDLGFTALWNTPLMEDNMLVTSYHTYAISDYYKIDPRYGTNEDYKRLSAEAAKRGIKLVMDVVTNHCGTAHWWMNDLPTADWVHPNKRCNFRVWTVQDTHAAEADKLLNTQGWFDTSMPDMNQSNPLVLDYLTQNTIWWVEYAGLGGLRIDTYPYNDKEPMAEFCNRIMAEYPAFNIVGECWMHEPIEVAYWQKGVENQDGYKSGLPCVMDFPLTDALCAFTGETQGWSNGVMRPYLSLAKDYLYADPFNMLVFADNHDTERLWHLIQNDVAKFKLIFTILSTTRGIPQVYYGTEIMMGGEKRIGDGDIRRDFPGGWAGDTINAFVAAGRTAEQNEVFDFMKNMLNWRKNNPVIHTGALKHFVPEDECYVYFRYNDDKKVMVVLNNSDKDNKNLDMSRFSEMLADMNEGRDIITGKAIHDLKTLPVPAKTAMVIELK